MKKLLLTAGLVASLFAGSQLFKDETYRCVTTGRLDNDGRVVYKFNEKQMQNTQLRFVKKGDVLTIFSEKDKFIYTRTYKNVDEYKDNEDMSIYILDKTIHVGSFFRSGLQVGDTGYQLYCKRVK